MFHNSLDNLISTRRAETAAGIDDFVLGHPGYDRRIVNILPAADADERDLLRHLVLVEAACSTNHCSV